jgi:glyoxylase I family protein
MQETSSRRVLDESSGRPAAMEMLLVVRDMDLMTQFYEDAVGLTHLYDFQTPGGLQRRFSIAEGAVFKIMKFDNTPDVSNPPGGIMGATGFRQLLLVVDDLEKTVSRAEAAGATIVRPIQTYGNGGPTICIVYDPEGNAVEFVQRES